MRPDPTPGVARCHGLLSGFVSAFALTPGCYEMRAVLRMIRFRAATGVSA